MTQPLDSRQLRAFASLARTGSFTATAQELHLSQSAISHSIKALEGEMGCRLLHRMGKTVVLTEAGEAFLVRVERVLQEMHAAREELSRLGKWGQARLRIGASTTACQYVLPAVLREFKKDFPRCAISIEPGDTPEAIESLRAHRIDLAVNLEPLRDDTLEFRPLFTDELQFVVGPGHAWAQAGRPAAGEIAAENYILYGKTSYTFRMIEAYFRQEQIVLRSLLDLGNMEAIKELVKLDLGVSILAPWTAEKELRRRLARRAAARAAQTQTPLGRPVLARAPAQPRRGDLHQPLRSDDRAVSLSRVFSREPRGPHRP